MSLSEGLDRNTADHNGDKKLVQIMLFK